MEEDDIEYFTSCKPLYFWQVCDLLREEGVEESGVFTYPVLTMLCFMRLRLGMPFKLLSILFDLKRETEICDRFWQVVSIYYNRANATCKLFNDISVDEEEINNFLEELIYNYDPLYRMICEATVDPLGLDRKCYVVNIDSKKWRYLFTILYLLYQM